MHDQDSSRRPAEAPNDDIDRRTEWAVLEFLFSEHPAQVTEAEILTSRSTGRPDFSGTDAIERAVIELVGAGLVRLQGESVIPTRSARYFDYLRGNQ